MFLLALAGSAAAVPALRPLHVFQAFIYVAVIVLSRRGSVWGLGAGVPVPIFWNSLELFVTHLPQAGASAFWSLLHTGQVHRVDTMMVTLGWIGHSILIVSCVLALLRLSPGRRQWAQCAAGGLLSLAYFGLIVATLLPR